MVMLDLGKDMTKTSRFVSVYLAFERHCIQAPLDQHQGSEAIAADEPELVQSQVGKPGASQVGLLLKPSLRASSWCHLQVQVYLTRIALRRTEATLELRQ